jgi:hypothetical protein
MLGVLMKQFLLAGCVLLAMGASAHAADTIPSEFRGKWCSSEAASSVLWRCRSRESASVRAEGYVVTHITAHGVYQDNGRKCPLLTATKEGKAGGYSLELDCRGTTIGKETWSVAISRNGSLVTSVEKP